MLSSKGNTPVYKSFDFQTLVGAYEGVLVWRVYDPRVWTERM